jgi:hypothetical protein
MRVRRNSDTRASGHTDWKALYGEAQAEIERLRGALREMVESGVEFDDERLSYLVVQVDREVWESARAALADERKQDG